MRRTLRFTRPLAATLHRRYTGLCQTLYTRVPGQGLVEYGLILVLIMVVCVAVLTLVGHSVSKVWYEELVTAFPS